MATKRGPDTICDEEPRSKILKNGLTVDEMWDALKSDSQAKDAEIEQLKAKLQSSETLERISRQSYVSQEQRVNRAEAEAEKWEGSFRSERLKILGLEDEALQLKSKLNSARVELRKLREHNKALLKKEQVADRALAAAKKFEKAFTEHQTEGAQILKSLMEDFGEGDQAAAEKDKGSDAKIRRNAASSKSPVGPAMQKKKRTSKLFGGERRRKWALSP